MEGNIAVGPNGYLAVTEKGADVDLDPAHVVLDGDGPVDGERGSDLLVEDALHVNTMTKVVKANNNEILKKPVKLKMAAVIMLPLHASLNLDHVVDASKISRLPS